MTRPLFWITVHWPHPKGGQLPWNVYLRKKYEHLGLDLRRGDHVLFYQTAEARSGKQVLRDVLQISTGCRVELERERFGLIAQGTALGPVEERPISRIDFEYGSNPFEWSLEAKCETQKFDEGLSHRDVKKAWLHYVFSRRAQTD
jgi:hypothetical protein